MADSSVFGEIRKTIANIGASAPVGVIGSGIVTLGAALYAAKRINQYHERCHLQIMIDKKRSLRDSKLVEYDLRYKTDDCAQYILSLSTEELMKLLQERNLTAVQVLKAFTAKSIAITKEFNCITEFVPDAFEMAAELDNLPSVKGPLHGVCFCVKDDQDVAGMDTTLGYAKNLNKPAEKNSVLVQILVDLGAIPFCKTNVPQSIFGFCGNNPIYGETVNHLNPNLSPGGSSSGTACLVGAGGCPFGLGSDRGGSVRIPSHFSGISALRPTQNRLSGQGVIQSLPKCLGLTGVPGIMAKDAQMVATVFRAVTSDSFQNKYDPQLPPIPWNDHVFQNRKSLRIGYFTSLKFFPAIGDTEETVIHAKRALEERGHKLIHFKISDEWKMMKLMYDLIAVDFGKHSHVKKMMENEPSAIGLLGLKASAGLPAWRRRIRYYMSKNPYLKSYSKRVSLRIGGGLDQSTSHDVWEMMHQRQEFIRSILTDMENAGVELLLAPAFPFPACRLHDTEFLFGAVVYTMIWNLVDFPAGVVPYGKESGNNINSYSDEGDAMLRLAKESTKQSIGSPIAVQLVGKPYCEELIFNILIELQSKKNECISIN